MKSTLFLKKSILSFQRLLIYFFISVLAFACGEDGNAPNLCLLTKSLASYHDGSTEEWNLTFNSNNQLVQYSSLFTSSNNNTNTYNFENTFDLNGNLIKEAYDDGHVDYTYNDKQVVKEEYFDGAIKKAVIESEYNSNGQIIKRQHYTVTSGNAVADYYSLVEYATTTTKNVKTITRFKQDDTLYSTIVYEYDNKINPWTLMGTMALFSHGENNITKETRTEGTIVTNYNYSYEYNTQGYPTKMNYTSSTGTTDYTEVYTYDCK